MKQKENAFTLIELLVVVAIVCVLASLAHQALSKTGTPVPKVTLPVAVLGLGILLFLGGVVFPIVASLFTDRFRYTFKPTIMLVCALLGGVLMIVGIKMM